MGAAKVYTLKLNRLVKYVYMYIVGFSNRMINVLGFFLFYKLSTVSQIRINDIFYKQIQRSVLVRLSVPTEKIAVSFSVFCI